jgi:hypothetical protein
VTRRLASGPACRRGDGVQGSQNLRRGLLACTLLFLVWLAWQALAGGLRQLPRSRTAGQKVETVAQLACGLLSLLVVLTCFWRRRWAPRVRAIWGISLATTAGLSALVWGPAMPLVAVLFTAIALLVARAIQWALRSAVVAISPPAVPPAGQTA